MAINLTNYDEPAQTPKSCKWHTLAATWLGAFFDGFDATIFVMVLVPALSELLKTKEQAQIGWIGSVIMAVFMLGWAIGAVVFGIMSDYIGRARTLTITILTYAIFTGLCAIANSWQEMAVYRFLVGCGIGGEIGIGGVLLSECWSGRSRLHVLSFMLSAVGVGYLATALLNLVVGTGGWRSLFWVGIAPALLTLYLRSHLNESSEFEFLKEAKRRAQLKTSSERTVQEKELLEFPFPRLFSTENIRNTLVVVAMASSAIMGYWAVLAWVPSWVTQVVGTVATGERSSATIAMNLGLVVACIVGGHIVSLLGRKLTFRIGCGGSFLCCLGMFGTVKSFGTSLLCWAFATGFCSVLPFIVLFIYIPELFDARIRGTAFGFSYNSGRILAAGAAICGGQLIGTFGGSFGLAAMSVSTVYLIGIAASFFMTNSPLVISVIHTEAVAEELTDAVAV